MADTTAVPQAPPQVTTIEALYTQYGEVCVQEKILLGRKAMIEQSLQQFLNQGAVPPKA